MAVTYWVSLFFRIVVTMCFCAMLLPAQSGGITTKDKKAKETVDAAIKALGGADKIGEIKSLIVRGTIAIIPGAGQFAMTGPITFEIRILLPDNFTVVKQTDDPQGISKGKMIAYPWMSWMEMEGLSIVERKERESQNNRRTNELIDDWSRFLIGTLMQAGAAQLTISGDSNPGVFTLTRKDGTVGEIEFDTKTGYPSVIRYKRPEFPMLFGYSTIPHNNNYTNDLWMRFADRFSVNGIMFPKVITMNNAMGLTHEWRVEEVRINPPLNPRDFERGEVRR